MPRGTLFLALIALLGAADQPRVPTTLPAAPARDFSRTPAVEVVDVRAGNVVVVQLAGEQRQLRLIGAFVPGAGTADDAARAYLWNLLRDEWVYIEYEADWPLKDRDGRYWAYVYRVPDGLFCNLELLRLGLARLSAPDPFEFKALFEKYEDHARRTAKGVWAKPPDSQPAAAAEPAAPRNAANRPEPVASPATAPAPASDDAIIVYTTKSGTKYHTAECRYAKSEGATTITLRAAKARGLTPCSRCKPPE